MPLDALKDQPFEQEVCTFFNRHHGLGFSETTDVAVTRDGTAWAANRLGLARFDGRRWEIVREPSGLAGGNTARLAADADGSLWVGSTTGVARLKDGRW
jgi:ligand-binding sensor domain-containing protein